MATEYTVYQIAADNHIAVPPTRLDADDDDEAVEKAEQFLDGQDLEIWQGTRLVARLPKRG
jgi:hypothetical protein